MSSLPSLSVCMIVKNEASFLPYTLPSLAEGADELIVVDTGSTDNSVEIAKQHQAIVSHFEWINDFSAAKNTAIRQASSDWILMMDADEYISVDALKTLKTLIKPNCLIYQLDKYECKKHETEPTDISFPRMKVFQNFQNIFYTNPISEQLTHNDSFITNSDHITDPTVYVCHWGGFDALNPKDAKAKRQRYIAHFEALNKTNPQPEYYFHLANAYYQEKNYSRAINHWKTITQLSCHDEFIVMAYVKLASHYKSTQKDYTTEKQLLQKAIAKSTHYPEPYVDLCLNLIRHNQLQEAKPYAHHILTLKQSDRITNIDRKHYVFWPYYFLSVIEMSEHNFSAAQHYLDQGLSHYPKDESLLLLQQSIKKLMG